MQDYRTLAADVVAELKRQGADSSDVYIIESSSSSISVRLGQVEKLEKSISHGLGMRVFKGGATAITYTTDFSNKSVKSLAKQVLDIVSISNADKFNGLAPKEALGVYGGELKMFDNSIAQISTERKIELARETESIGMKFDQRITNSQGASWSDGINQVTLATSDGFVGQYQTTGAGLSVSLLAEENGIKQTDGWFTSNRFAGRLASPKEVGEEAARRVIRKLGGRKIKSQVVPVVVDPMISARLARLLFAAASGPAIYRKTSYLVDKVGQQIASPLISLIDDATIVDGPASRPFDGEGIKSSQLAVIEDGVLKSYVCDSYSARRLSLKPTGNAARSYQSAPGVSASNLLMKPGKSSPAEIIKSVKGGLYLTTLFSQGYNGVTGDLSMGAAGFWIENGELTHPVQEITLAGNLLTMAKNITMVGNDVSFKLGSAAAPTLLISEATIGGA